MLQFQLRVGTHHSFFNYYNNLNNPESLVAQTQDKKLK